ncbi:GNAT family N-acetyltransferase [Streptomyces lydicus]|uniref:GNAT family N-acetyltransferase n=1 Tax=Streptomyces lydicus TaxID=47763 RepID=UPI0033C67468
MVGAAYAVRRRTPLAGTDLEPENGWILFFFVDPAHRRGGLGRRLLTDALQWLRGHGPPGSASPYAPHYVLPGLDRAAYPEAARLLAGLGFRTRYEAVASLAFLPDPDTALPSVIVVQAWASLGTGILILTAGLKAIPEVSYEAAELDGAGRGTVFRRITLPLLRPSLLFVCLTQFIAGLQSFALINVMTGDGGPGDATNVAAPEMYQQAFTYGDWGPAAAATFVLFLGPGEFGKLPFRFLPQAFDLSNYRTALYQLNLPLLFRNSVVATVVITGSTLMTSALAGYALAICWGAAAPASPSASPLSSCRSWCPASY